MSPPSAEDEFLSSPLRYLFSRESNLTPILPPLSRAYCNRGIQARLRTDQRRDPVLLEKERAHAVTVRLLGRGVLVEPEVAVRETDRTRASRALRVSG